MLRDRVSAESTIRLLIFETPSVIRSQNDLEDLRLIGLVVLGERRMVFPFLEDE